MKNYGKTGRSHHIFWTLLGSHWMILGRKASVSFPLKQDCFGDLGQMDWENEHGYWVAIATGGSFGSLREREWYPWLGLWQWGWRKGAALRQLRGWMCKIWGLIINGKLSCVKNKSKVSSVHTLVNSCSILGTENTGWGRDFMQKIKGSKTLNLLSFECLRDGWWKYCVGSQIFRSGDQRIRVIST